MNKHYASDPGLVLDDRAEVLVRLVPMLFRGEMVRALLNTKVGRWPAEAIDSTKPFKWQTRRPVKPQPVFEGRESFGDSWKWKKGEDWFSGVTTDQLVGRSGLKHKSRAAYSPSDCVWVKETFSPQPQLNARAYYRADDPLVGVRWKPSIFMPWALSRIHLEIMDVRIERVNEISESAAKAEGVALRFSEGAYFDGHGYSFEFSNLWNSIHGKGSFESGPWVWVLSFKRIR